MLAMLRGSPGNILALKASDRLAREDYQELVPHVQQMIDRHGSFRVMLILEDFLGWEPLAALDDMQLGEKYAGALERCAIVGEESWQKWMLMLSLSFLNVHYSPDRTRYFLRSESQAGWQWIREGILTTSFKRQGSVIISPERRTRLPRRDRPAAVSSAGKSWEWVELKS